MSTPPVPEGPAPDRPTPDRRRPLTDDEVAPAVLAGWGVAHGHLVARVTTGDFAAGLALVDRVGAAAEAADHHPDVVLTYAEVVLRLHSHDVGALTSRDVDLARTVSALVVEAGLVLEPAGRDRCVCGAAGTTA